MAVPHHTPELRPIPDFPGYFADAAGNIWSTRNKQRPGPFMLTAYDNGARLSVAVSRGCKSFTMTVHRLVASAWIGDGDGLPVVRHLDGNHRNNAPSNLAWGTQQHNMDDARRHGTLAIGERSGARLHPERLARGERVGGARLTAEQVRAIRAMHAEGRASQKELAHLCGVTAVCVHLIVARKTWRHVA